VSGTLTAAYQEGLASIRLQVAEFVGSVWDAMAWPDDAEIPGFVATVAPAVEGAQRAAVEFTDAYVGHLLNRAPLGLDTRALVGAAARAGVAPVEVYRRPFVSVWTSLSKGADPVSAVATGRARLTLTAETDVQLATRAAANAVGDADSLILGWQRVPDAGACPFCLTVAGQRYHRAQLMPIHPRCGCTVEPITGSERSRFSGRLEKDTAQVAVHEHGELGAVLTGAHEQFTGPEDI
jgi:hypothetical protein